MSSEGLRSVSFITGQLGLGGAEKQLCLLIERLTRLGWRVSVITLNPGKGDHWEEFLRKLEVPVIPISPGFPARRMISIARNLKRRRPQIVHGWVYHANPYASLCGRIAGVPVRLGSVRGYPEHWPGSRLLRLTALFGPSAIVTNSQAALRALSRLNGRYLPPLHVVPNGVLIPELTNRDQLRASLAQKWGLRTDVPWLVALGRLDENKNWGVLLEASARLAGQGVEFQIVFIGEGPEKEHLANEISRLDLSGLARLVGEYADASVILHAFDVLCLTSKSEGLPNVVMEASAAGVPVATTAVGGAPEVIEDGVTGYLVPPDDVDLLAPRLNSLIVDAVLRRTMGRAGREKMQREFSVGEMVNRMVSVYENPLRATGAA